MKEEQESIQVRVLVGDKIFERHVVLSKGKYGINSVCQKNGIHVMLPDNWSAELFSMEYCEGLLYITQKTSKEELYFGIPNSKFKKDILYNRFEKINGKKQRADAIKSFSRLMCQPNILGKDIIRKICRMLYNDPDLDTWKFTKSRGMDIGSKPIDLFILNETSEVAISFEFKIVYGQKNGSHY